jgi:hypothetical protein
MSRGPYYNGTVQELTALHMWRDAYRPIWNSMWLTAVALTSFIRCAPPLERSSSDRSPLAQNLTEQPRSSRVFRPTS